MAKMSKEVMDVFNDPGSAKVLATAGSTVLEINAVPKGSLRAVGEDVIAFADIFGDKTNKNLQLNKKVSALGNRKFQEGASQKCPSRAFIMLKFLEAERVMNKKLN